MVVPSPSILRRSSFVTLQREFQLVAWLEAADPMPAARVGSNAQARAPPAIS